MGKTSVARAAMCGEFARFDRTAAVRPWIRLGGNAFDPKSLDIFESRRQYMSYTTYRMRRRLEMTHLTIPSLIGYTWGALGLVWLAGLAFTKGTVHSEPMGPRLFQIAIILFGFTLLGNTRFSA